MFSNNILIVSNIPLINTKNKPITSEKILLLVSLDGPPSDGPQVPKELEPDPPLPDSSSGLILGILLIS